jgi:hypothetical protein
MSDKPIESRGSIRLHGHAECPAAANRLGEFWRHHRGGLDARDERIEMVLEQVFEQAGGDCHPEVGVGMRATQSKRPEGLGARLHELRHGDDRLPTWVAFSFRRLFAW